jgi:peptidoglycan/xylan/chitin deacetylase (PgdA/CDA1 family)
MLARMTLLWLGLLTATAAAETVPACWAPGDLVHREGEERVQRGVAQARITAPKRTLAEYSPVAARGAVRRVQLPPGKKLVALTFDLCEQPSEISGYQGGIVDFLRSKGIKATFFIGGKWMLSHRERTQQLMADPMFEVANHTWEHRNLRLTSGQALVDEIRNAQLAYEQVRAELQAKQCMGPQGNALAHERAPRRLGLMRFPYGACSPAALSEVAQQGPLAHPVGRVVRRSNRWTVGAGDPATGPLQCCSGLDRAVPRQRPGLAHGRRAPRRDRRAEGARLRVRDGFGAACRRRAGDIPDLLRLAAGRCRPVAVPAPRARRRRAVRLCLAVAERGAEALEKMAREWHVRGARSAPPPIRASHPIRDS